MFKKFKMFFHAHFTVGVLDHDYEFLSITFAPFTFFMENECVSISCIIKNKEYFLTLVW